MTASTSKKVVVRRFDRESLTGYVNPKDYLRAEGIELLSLSGRVMLLPYKEIKAVCFVKDFGSAEAEPAQRLFQNRPKAEGLWVRMRFADGEMMDGILPNNLLQLETYGFTLTPPNPSSNNQRVFVPKGSLEEFVVLGVVGSPLRKRKTRPSRDEKQLRMFES